MSYYFILFMMCWFLSVFSIGSQMVKFVFLGGDLYLVNRLHGNCEFFLWVEWIR